MKELLLQLSAYHLWANDLLLDTITALPQEKHRQEVPSSFNSLYKTVLHLLDAENIWWQRIRLEERIVVPSASFSGDMKVLAAAMKKQSLLWDEWLHAVHEHQLQHVFKYQNSKRESFKQPVYQIVLHVMNHGTYHRGQMVTMLRQLGVDKIPETDFVVWTRKRKVGRVAG